MYRLDIGILQAINHNRIHALDPFIIAITDTAFLISVLIPTLLLLIGIIKRQRNTREMAYQVFLSHVISSLLTSLLKQGINRTRPYVGHPFIERLTTVITPSFPSGHTTDAFIIAFSVTLLTRRPLFLVPVWLWAFMVGYSRMALGVHYPTDVLGGIILSFLAALLGRALFLMIKDYKKAKETTTG